MEQALEWNASLYLGFIGYEKAFDSVHRETLLANVHYKRGNKTKSRDQGDNK